MIVNETLYTGMPGIVQMGSIVLGSNRVVRTSQDPIVDVNSPLFTCLNDNTVRWRKIKKPFLSATTVCLLETQKRLKP